MIDLDRRGAPTVDYALAYVDRGWSVVPLVARTKRPAVTLAPFLSGESKWTASEARAWWANNPDDGIAIVTGLPSGLVVIDVDPRNGGNSDDAINSAFVDDELMLAETGGGGIHIFCEHPGGAPIPKGKTSRPGVDRQSDGGYVVAAPSIHPDSGMPYRWVGDGPLVRVPGWVLEKPVSVPDGETREPWVADTLTHPESCTPGGQEDTLTRLCWWASKRLPYDIALPMLASWANRLPLGNPHEPWTEEHVADRLTRAYEKRAAEPPSFNVTLAAPLPMSSAPPPTAAAIAGKVSALKEKVRTARAFTEAAERDAASVDWLARDFIAPGCWTEIIGVMKEGKSTLVCGMLRSLLEGADFLGRPCRKTNVLYLTEQVGISFKATLERGKLTESDSLFVLTIADLFGLPWDAAAVAAVDIAKEQGCGVIIVDTLARLAGLTEEDEAASVQCLNPFLKARAEGVAVVFVRHGRKSGGAINVAARGSGAITGEMDVCLYITAPKGVASTYRHLEGVSRLTDTIQEHLEYQGGSYVIGEAPEEKRREARAEPVVEALGKNTVAGTTPTELIAATGLAERTVKRRLSELQACGRAVSRDGRWFLQAATVTLAGIAGGDDATGD